MDPSNVFAAAVGITAALVAVGFSGWWTMLWAGMVAELAFGHPRSWPWYGWVWTAAATAIGMALWLFILMGWMLCKVLRIRTPLQKVASSGLDMPPRLMP